MRLLDRYVLRNFLEPFLLCSLGFIAILLIFDLYDNGQDFVEYHVKFKTILAFYGTQLPAMALLALPVGLLLALLYSLSRLSRHNEIISMLTAGRSLVRVLLPLLVIGLCTVGVFFYLNSAAAPHAEAIKKQMLEEITRGSRRAAARETLEGHLFRDRLNNRTWFVKKLRPGNPQLDTIHVVQQDAEGNIERKWYAARALYDAQTGHWTLNKGMIVDFDKSGDIIRTDSFPNRFRVIEDWTETPWRIASSQLQAQNLSIAELHDYLRYNFDFPPALLAPYRTNLADRWAYPWSCLVLVFIAAPLGVVYNRRGVIGAVAGAIFLFVANNFLLRGFLLALGKGGRLDPYVAAWAANAVFFVLGLFLLWFRNTNRDFPKLAFWR